MKLSRSTTLEQATPTGPEIKPVTANNKTAKSSVRLSSASAPSKAYVPLTSSVIEMHRIVKTYVMGEHEVHALASVDFSVERGDFVAIMGASGSGKSTLMNIIGCLDIPTKGRYFLDGVDIARLDEDQLATARNRKIGFVFQSFNLIPRTSAIANVELPMSYAGIKPAIRRERALAALNTVGLSARVDHLPSELSGGQQQRVAVARAIATNPALLLADEPTGNLDSTSTMEVLDVFNQLNDQGRTVVVITHEDEVAARAKRIVRLKDGLIIEDRRIRGVHQSEAQVARLAIRAQQLRVSFADRFPNDDSEIDFLVDSHGVALAQRTAS